jgi:hypothetical protein
MGAIKNALHTIDIRSEYAKAKNSNTKEDNLVLLEGIWMNLTQ